MGPKRFTNFLRQKGLIIIYCCVTLLTILCVFVLRYSNRFNFNFSKEECQNIENKCVFMIKGPPGRLSWRIKTSGAVANGKLRTFCKGKGSGKQKCKIPYFFNGSQYIEIIRDKKVIRRIHGNTSDGSMECHGSRDKWDF